MRRNALKRRYGVGDPVKVNFGGRKTSATVVEDRGDLGVKGAQILRVRIDTEDGKREFEVPANTVTKSRTA